MDLIEAIQANNLSETERLLAAGADPNQRGHSHTPLTLAASRGQLEILELLLRNGADLEQADAELARDGLKRMIQFGGKETFPEELFGHTALLAAARHGQARVAVRLLELGADFQRRDFLNESALQWAAEAGHLEVVQALLQAGAPAESKALMAALQENHPECALALLECGAVPDQKSLVQAAYLADARILRKMLALKPKLKAGKALAPIGYATRLVPADQAPPGRWTIVLNEKGYFKQVPEPEDKLLEAAEVLLQAGAAVNEVSSVGPALYVAASQGLTRLVQRLLEAGADPTQRHRDSTPLQIANLMGHEATARLLQNAPSLAPKTL